MEAMADEEAQVSNPRIFQGTPLTEVPLSWLEHRYDTERIAREKAAEVAPGVFVQVISWGDHFTPGGEVTSGARIAVWDERAPVTPQLERLVEELHGKAEHYQQERGRLGGHDEEALRRVQVKAAYFSGLQFGFEDAAHMLARVLRLEKWLERRTR